MPLPDRKKRICIITNSPWDKEKRRDAEHIMNGVLTFVTLGTGVTGQRFDVIIDVVDVSLLSEIEVEQYADYLEYMKCRNPPGGTMLRL